MTDPVAGAERGGNSYTAWRSHGRERPRPLAFRPAPRKLTGGERAGDLRVMLYHARLRAFSGSVWCHALWVAHSRTGNSGAGDQPPTLHDLRVWSRVHVDHVRL